MVRDEADLRKTILKVISFLEARIELNTVILFGSYADGQPHEFSDIDLAVISSDLNKKTMDEKAKLFSAVKIQCDADIELHLYGDDAISEARETNFLGYILRHGKYVMKDKKLVA